MKVLTLRYLCRNCGARFVKTEQVNGLEYEQSRIVAGEGMYPLNRRFFAEDTCCVGVGIGIGDLIAYEVK